jgi:oligopeptide transport system ATP-binding protein
MRLNPETNTIVRGGEILFEGEDLLTASEKRMQSVRGPKIAMVFQDPMTSLDPTMRIGPQIVESLKKHLGMTGRQAAERAVELLKLVGIPNAEARLKQYPHQFSGGMRQRVVIAIALACDPQVLIADEPTTALDVTIQAQILELMRELQDRLGMSIILITHDLGVVASTAHRVAVMYGGRIVETGTVREIFYNPQMPYTWGLLASIPLPNADSSLELIPIPAPRRTPRTPRRAALHLPLPLRHEGLRRRDAEPTTFSPEHWAACWLHHPMAPKVEPPARVGVRGDGDERLLGQRTGAAPE